VIRFKTEYTARIAANLSTLGLSHQQVFFCCFGRQFDQY